jgi:Tol biopolymer transport system component
MSGNRRHDLERICQAALDRDPAARSAFLADACAGDDALRHEVESLLAQEPAAEGFMEALAPGTAAESVAERDGVIGQSIGPYHVVSWLGAGGMGEVYQARDTRLNRDVALKILPGSYAQQSDWLARFRREARVLASLSHSNIAIIHGLEQMGNVHALVMELVPGDDLSQRLARGSIPIDDALRIAKQVAEALEAAHEQRIVHCDLKPANIKVRADGTVKVLDFGLAKAMEPVTGGVEEAFERRTVTTPAMTQVGVIFGTAAYMSPEQARGKLIDKRTDIWAFGCLLFEMLAGRRAFMGADVPETLAAVLKGEPDWTALPATTPPSIRSLLRRCLQRELEPRLRDISDARFQIEDALNEPPGARVSASPGRLGEWLLWAGGAVTVAVAAAAGTWYFTSAPPEADELRLEISTPATTGPTSIAISPDGRMIVFAAIAKSREELWLRPLNSPAVRALPGTEGAQYPFWSPDSESIGFFADAQLKRIDVESGVVQTLAAAATPLGGEWNADDTILFTPGPSSPVVRIPAAGGSPTPVGHVSAAAQNHRFPRVLPDGRHFLFYAQGTAPGIYVGQVDALESRRLLEADAAVFAMPGQLLFVRQGALYAQAFDPERIQLTGKPTVVEQRVVSPFGVGSVALSASTNGRIVYRPGRLEGMRRLIWFDRSGKELERVPGFSWEIGIAMAMSPDGRTVASDQVLGGTADIWLFDLVRRVSTRFTSDPEFEIYPVWSPDGKRIAYQSSGKSAIGSTFDTYVKSVSGAGNADLLVGGERGQLPTDWSPDGRFVLYTDTGKGIWAVSTEGDRKPFPVVETTLGAHGAQFSPDGKWIAYQSRESGQRAEIFVQRFPGPGAKSQISVAGGVQVRWRGDGKELFYVAPDNQLMAVPIRFEAHRDTVDVGTPVPLFAPRFSGNPQGPSNRQYMVSPDGQRFLIDSPAEVTLPVTVVLNWKANP